MRRLSSIIIPLPVSILFLAAFAYAGWHMAGKAASSGLELQILKLQEARR